MSYQQYFDEVEAVATVLEDFSRRFDEVHEEGGFVTGLGVGGVLIEDFAAIWQAAELLSRAYQVLYPLVALDVAKAALVLPDVRRVPDAE